MELQRETTTDCLADIIHLIHLGGKSGTLTVERSLKTTLEEGFIVFAAGKGIEAKVGQQRGLAAFNYLNMWKTCRFSFIDHAFNEVPTSSQPGQFSLSKQIISPANTSVANILSTDTVTPRSQKSTYGGPAEASARPFRLHLGEIAVQHPEAVRLTRKQRRLLLLVNGRRSVGELAKLTIRSSEETMALLNELERAGFIQW